MFTLAARELSVNDGFGPLPLKKKGWTPMVCALGSEAFQLLLELVPLRRAPALKHYLLEVGINKTWGEKRLVFLPGRTWNPPPLPAPRLVTPITVVPDDAKIVEGP
jgi:hypothetical protein